MLRHIAMFRLKEDAPAGTLETLSKGLAHLASSIPTISAYTYGPDLGLRAGNFDVAVVADFEDAEGFATYVDHPEHQAFLKDLLMPVLAERAAMQFER